MKRALMIASVASMIDQFNLPNIELIIEMGYEVDVACNFINGNTCSIDKINSLKEKLIALNVSCYQIDFSRSIVNVKSNIKAYKQLSKLICTNKYTLIHCHSPIGGVIGRLASRKFNIYTIYTAHGFHFYKGAPIKNWLLYYPVEKLCSRWTDALITINQEDYELAKKKMHAKKVYYIPGVGIDVDKFANTVIDRDKKRAELGIPADAFLLISIGELSKRKNHEVILKTLASIKEKNIYYAVVGQGTLHDYLLKLAIELGINDRVRFLGYRRDINELLKASNIFCFPSLQEGLPVALMETMASGLPCIASRIRGNVDLIEDNIGGILCEPTDVDGFAKAVANLLSNDDIRIAMISKSSEAVKQFDIDNVINEMSKIYSSL